MTNFYIFQGGPENLRWWLKNDEYHRDHQSFWSANKHVRPSDVVFIYLTAPLSRIVGTVSVLGDPFFNPRANSMFLNPHMLEKWCVEVGYPFYFGDHEELKLSNLRRLFGADWGWVRYPRGNTRIPNEIVSPFLELISPFCDKLAIRISPPEVKI